MLNSTDRLFIWLLACLVMLVVGLPLQQPPVVLVGRYLECGLVAVLGCLLWLKARRS